MRSFSPAAVPSDSCKEKVLFLVKCLTPVIAIYLPQAYRASLFFPSVLVILDKVGSDVKDFDVTVMRKHNYSGEMYSLIFVLSV